MTLEEKKINLIELLKAEKNLFAQRGQDITEHDIAIQYLMFGKTNYNPSQWELLDAVINDFEMIYSDYTT